MLVKCDVLLYVLLKVTIEVLKHERNDKIAQTFMLPGDFMQVKYRIDDSICPCGKYINITMK